MKAGALAAGSRAAQPTWRRCKPRLRSRRERLAPISAQPMFWETRESEQARRPYPLRELEKPVADLFAAHDRSRSPRRRADLVDLVLVRTLVRQWLTAHRERYDGSPR